MSLDFEAMYMSMNTVFIVISFIVLTAGAGIAYITRKLWFATAGASYFWMFLSAFTGTIAVYAAISFAKTTFLTAYAVPLQSIQDVAMVSAAIYAFVSAIFVGKMFKEIME